MAGVRAFAPSCLCSFVPLLLFAPSALLGAFCSPSCLFLSLAPSSRLGAFCSPWCLGRCRRRHAPALYQYPNPPPPHTHTHALLILQIPVARTTHARSKPGRARPAGRTHRRSLHARSRAPRTHSGRARSDKHVPSVTRARAHTHTRTTVSFNRTQALSHADGSVRARGKGHRTDSRTRRA